MRARRDEVTKVGITKKKLTGMAGNIPIGTVVLFRVDSNFNQEMTVEVPMTMEEITSNVSRGSLVKTKNSMVGVPVDFVEEIIFE